MERFYQNRRLHGQSASVPDAPIKEADEQYCYTFSGWSEDCSTIDYGGNAVLPANPTRSAEEWGTWKFVNWNGNYTSITKDEIITAEFEKVFNEYSVIFYDGNGNILSEQTIVYGQSAIVPDTPKKKQTHSILIRLLDGVKIILRLSQT